MKPCAICGKYKRRFHWSKNIMLERAKAHDLKFEMSRGQQNFPICHVCANEYGFNIKSTIKDYYSRKRRCKK